MSETACTRCGAFGDLPHGWVEGDCVLPHKNHSRATIGHVCRHCVDRQRDWLREIVELYGTLYLVIEPGSVPDDTAEHGKPRKQPASPAPLRLDAWAMLFDRLRLYRTGRDADLPDVPAVLADLAQRCIDSQGWTATAPDTITGAAAHLTAHAEHIAREPWIDEYDAELGWVRRRLRAAHGIADRKPVGRCPSLDGYGRECGGPLWLATDGGMAVDCGRCRRHFDETFLRHLGGLLAAQHAETG